MGSNSSKHSVDRARESRTKKNLRSADRLERDRHSDNSFFHRQPNYEDIRSQALRRAHGSRISDPMPASLPTMPLEPAPIYHRHSADRRPPPPPKTSPPSPSSVFTFASAVPAPLNIVKKTTTHSAPPTHRRPSSSKHSGDVPSTGRPMFPPATNAPPSIPGQYYPPTSSRTKTTRSSSSRRKRSRSPKRQPSPKRPQSSSSRRHGPSTARYPPSSDRAPPPLSSRNIVPQAQHGSVAPPAPHRSGRRRASRDDDRGRRLC